MFTLASPGQILSTDNLKHWSEELVYWIPPDRTSVTWFTGTLKHAGKLVHGQAHANQRWFESMYLFSGSPESLGLNKGQFQVCATRKHRLCVWVAIEAAPSTGRGADGSGACGHGAYPGGMRVCSEGGLHHG
jgi:hypothetical protein